MKKFLALVLSVLMIVSAVSVVSAFDDVAATNRYADAIEDLVDKGIITGFSATEFKPDESVTRWQMALMMVKAYTGVIDNAKWEAGLEVFSDIKSNHYPAAIAKAAGAGIINGRGDGIFDPDSKIMYQDALVMAVRALGYEDKNDDGVVTTKYPDGYLAKASDLGLTSNVAVSSPTAFLTRAETAQIINNMIYTEFEVAKYDRTTKTWTYEMHTFAEDNFDSAFGADDYATFVVVGTVDQTFGSFTNTSNEDLETIWLAKVDDKGNITANVVEMSCADLGIKYSEIEEYFGRAIYLINFNETKGTYKSVYIGDVAAVVTNSDVTIDVVDATIAGDALTAIDYDDNLLINDGKTTSLYYVVNALTGDALKNEIVIFDGDDDYDVLDTDDLTGNYVLDLYDDDFDGKYDRAVKHNIYLSVFNRVTVVDKTEGTTKDTTVTGTTATRLWDPAVANNNTYVYAEGVSKLSRGDVFYYTYNPETATVTVLGTVDAKEGTVTSINKTNKTTVYDAKKEKLTYVNEIKLTIDGKVYYVGNTSRELAGLTGANIASNGSTTYASVTEFDKKIAGVGSTTAPVINYTANIWNEVTLKDGIKFYALGDTIIAAVKADEANTFSDNVVIMKEDLNPDDFEAIAIKVLNNKGKTQTVKVSVFKYESAGGTTVTYKLADYNNVLKLASIIDTLSGKFKAGSILKLTENADGETYTATLKTTATLGLIALDQPSYKFKEGIADMNTSDVSFSDQKKSLITDANTIFIFVNTDEDPNTDDYDVVSILTGKKLGTESSLTLSSNLKAYADKVGYGTASENGTASIVYIEYNEDSRNSVRGFGNVVSAVTNTNAIYVKDLGEETAVLGSDLGYTGDDAEEIFYVYENEEGLGFNLNTGKVVTRLIVAKADGITVTGKNIFNVYANDVERIVSAANLGANNSATIAAEDFVESRYWVVKDSSGNELYRYANRDIVNVIGVSADDYATVLEGSDIFQLFGEDETKDVKIAYSTKYVTAETTCLVFVIYEA